MEFFVNRDEELNVIDDAFQKLQDKESLIKDPIIEFQGVGGIGKTFLLKQVVKRCKLQHLTYLWVDVNQSPANISHQIINETKKHLKLEDTATITSPVHATRTLLQQGPVVMLLDSVDRANEEQQKRIVTILRELLDHEKFLAILTSKKSLSFSQERSVARKLKLLSLKALNRSHCDSYLDQQAHGIETEVRDLIFDWTRGYPLAMTIMTQAITNGLDPRTEAGQNEMLALLDEQIINQQVLARTSTTERTNYRSALQLLSVPRRFNLVIMQDLIEKFNLELRRETIMSYFSYFKDINNATDILNWSMTRAGFSIDEPLRNLFLLMLKNREPERYFKIHDFLAQTNFALAKETSGSDHVRYVREYLYHIASNPNALDTYDQLKQAINLIQQAPVETFLQFKEEFSQDEELQATLDIHLPTLQAVIAQRLAEINPNDQKDNGHV